MWCLVTRKGGTKIGETFSNVATEDTGYEWGGPLYMRTDFDLIEKPGMDINDKRFFLYTFLMAKPTQCLLHFRGKYTHCK